jgi:molybdenum cofactor cytidylyltransferase
VAEPGAGPVALVLGAGGSERWGGSPKALLPVGEVPAIGRVLRTLRAAGLSKVIVVLGASAEAIAGEVVGAFPEAEVVVNAAWALGRSGSIQLGLRAVEAPQEVLLWPVDQPFARVDTVRGILDAARRDALATWIIPEFDGRGGHPVLLKPPAWRLVHDLAPDAPLRSLLPSLGPQVLRLPVDDAGVMVNLNTPEAYQRAMGALARGEIG